MAAAAVPAGRGSGAGPKERPGAAADAAAAARDGASAPGPSDDADERARRAPAGQAHAAFDALYRTSARRVMRQTYLLTGNVRQAHRAVRRAFGLAWRDWPAVASSGDPEGWLRAAAADVALSPWLPRGPRRAHAVHLVRPHVAHVVRPQDAASERRLLVEAVRRIPRTHRRAMVLHDVVGLPLPETAREVESSVPAAEGRVWHAHAALAHALPELLGADPDDPGFGERLGGLLDAAAAHVDVRLHEARRVRRAGRRRAALLVGSVAALVAAFVATTAAFLARGPGHAPNYYPDRRPAASSAPPAGR